MGGKAYCVLSKVTRSLEHVLYCWFQKTHTRSPEIGGKTRDTFNIYSIASLKRRVPPPCIGAKTYSVAVVRDRGMDPCSSFLLLLEEITTKCTPFFPVEKVYYHCSVVN